MTAAARGRGHSPSGALRPRAPRGLHAALVLLAAGALAATEVPDLHVEQVDATAAPRVSVVVSTVAPPLDPDGVLHVLRDGDDVPVEVAEVPPRDLEVVVVVDASEGVPEGGVRATKSAVMDLMLRLEPGAQVSLVDMGDPPEVLAGAGTGVQARMVATTQIERGGARSLRSALDLALAQFSGDPEAVRQIVVAGPPAAAGAAPEVLVDAARRHGATVHVLRPEVGAGEPDPLEPVVESSGGMVATAGSPDVPSDSVARLVARLSNLYRLTFDVPEPAAAVSVRFRDTEAAVPLPDSGAAPPTGATTPPTPTPGVPPAPDGSASLLPGFVIAAAAGALVLLTAGVAFGAVQAARTTAGAPPAAYEEPPAAYEEPPAAYEEPPAAYEEPPADVPAASALPPEADEEPAVPAAAPSAAGFEGRLAAVVLTASPVAVAVTWTLLFAGGRFSQLVSGPASVAAFLGAIVLTVVGGLWLHRATRPPFTPWPARWRAYDRRATAGHEGVDPLDPAYGDTAPAAAVPAAALVPFLVCIVPATALFLVAGWWGAGAG